jgi:hypothetical protein
VVEPSPSYRADGSSFHGRTVPLERRLSKAGRAFTCWGSLRPRRDDHIVPVLASTTPLPNEGPSSWPAAARNISSIQLVATKRDAES